VQDLTIFGLSEGGAVLLSQVVPQMSPEQLHRLASGKLEDCHEVEVWQGPVRILRLRRS
jgi:hypothetical protein